MVTQLEIPLSQEFMDAVWTRYAESIKHNMFPVIDALWFVDDRVMIACYKMFAEHYVTLPGNTTSLEELIKDHEEMLERTSGPKFEAFAEEAVLFAIKQLRIVHGIPAQQSLFIEDGTTQRLVTFIYPQREVW